MAHGVPLTALIIFFWKGPAWGTFEEVGTQLTLFFLRVSNWHTLTKVGIIRVIKPIFYCGMMGCKQTFISMMANVKFHYNLGDPLPYSSIYRRLI